MKLHGTNPKEGAMVRRSLPFLATLAALVLIFVAVAPVAAYNNANPYHLRQSRLDPVKCGTKIEIQALLTDKKGHPVAGKVIHFYLFDSKPGDKVSPRTLTTNKYGKVFTFVTLKCTNYTRRVELLAEGPKGAKSLITLVLRHKDHDGDDDNDKDDGHHHGRTVAAGFVAVSNGSVGPGSGSAVSAATRSVSTTPVASTSLSSMALLPVGPVLLGLMFFLRTAFRRRSTLRVPRLATA